jgi:hypothetical protein
MGEIKSTLDLVMEKTKHLNLNSEEKQKQLNIEIGKHINGFLQKFQDGTLTRAQLIEECARLLKGHNLSSNAIVVGEILNRLDLSTDNREWMDLLKDLFDVSTGPLEKLLDAYQEAMNSVASYRRVKLRENLAREHHISGSAVVPNLAADAEWLAESGDVRSQFELKLDEVKSGILAAKGD